MKKICLVLLVLFALSMVGCSNYTSGNLNIKAIDSDSVDVHYSFTGLPKAVDNGKVFLNGEVVGSISGKGVKRFDNVEPNTIFKLTTATMTLSTVVFHAK